MAGVTAMTNSGCGKAGCHQSKAERKEKKRERKKKGRKGEQETPLCPVEQPSKVCIEKQCIKLAVFDYNGRKANAKQAKEKNEKINGVYIKVVNLPCYLL